MILEYHDRDVILTGFTLDYKAPGESMGSYQIGAEPKPATYQDSVFPFTISDA